MPERIGDCSRALTFASFTSGMGVMVLELSATRAMAPYFGSSHFIWTNVIGVVLLALAMGALLGGRLADRSRSLRPLASTLLIGGLLAIPGAFGIGVLSEGLLPTPAATLGAASVPHPAFGSLIVCCVFLLPPLLLAGMVGPQVVRGLESCLGGIGPAAGRALAASTVGSLIGTYLPAHWLLDQCGVRWTLLIGGAILIVGGLPLLAARRPVEGGQS